MTSARSVQRLLSPWFSKPMSASTILTRVLRSNCHSSSTLTRGTTRTNTNKGVTCFIARCAHEVLILAAVFGENVTTGQAESLHLRAPRQRFFFFDSTSSQHQVDLQQRSVGNFLFLCVLCCRWLSGLCQFFEAVKLVLGHGEEHFIFPAGHHTSPVCLSTKTELQAQLHR